jgi:cell division protein FtsB
MLAKNKKTKKQGRWQNIIPSVLLGIFLAAAIYFLVFSNLQMNQKRAGLISRVEELKKEIQLLSERNEQLKAGIIKTEDEDYWKGRLAEQGYFPPGEQPIVVIPPSEEEKDAESAKDKSLLETIKEMFGF